MRASRLGVLAIASLTAAPAALLCAQDTSSVRSPEALAAEIAALRAEKPAWREITWRSCLLEGLREAREKKKPAILWVFIDRPADDARC